MFALRLLYFFRFHFVLFFLSRVTLDERYVNQLHIFMFFVSSWRGSKKFEDKGGRGLTNFRTRGGGVTDFRGIFAGGSVTHYMPYLGEFFNSCLLLSIQQKPNTKGDLAFITTGSKIDLKKKDNSRRSIVDTENLRQIARVMYAFLMLFVIFNMLI